MATKKELLDDLRVKWDAYINAEIALEARQNEFVTAQEALGSATVTSANAEAEFELAQAAVREALHGAEQPVITPVKPPAEPTAVG